MSVLATTLRQRLAEADALVRSGRYPRARLAFEDLLERAQDRADRSMQVLARSMIAFCAIRAHQPDEAQATLDDTRELLSHVSTEAIGRFRGVEARLLLETVDRDEARDRLLAFYQWAQHASAWEALVDAALLLVRLVEAREKVSLLEPAVSLARDHGVVVGLGAAHNALAQALDELDAHDDAQHHFQQSLDWFSDHGTQRDIAGAGWAIGAHAGRIEDWPGARTWLEQSLAICESNSDCADLVCFILLDLARVYEAAGDVVEARRLVLRALRLAREQELRVAWPQRWRDLVTVATRLELDV